jgi:hypothetical protein
VSFDQMVSTARLLQQYSLAWIRSGNYADFFKITVSEGMVFERR